MTAYSLEPTTAGLLLSLANTCPAKALRRRAAALARRLVRPHPRALDLAASELLARLLDAADTEAPVLYAEDGIISPEWDE